MNLYKRNRFIYKSLMILIISIFIAFALHTESTADMGSLRRVDFVTKDINDFEDKISFDDGEYKGILKAEKNGYPEMTVKEQSNSKEIQNWAVNTGTVYPAITYSYSKDGYEGILNRVSLENNGSEQNVKIYQPKIFYKEMDNIATSYYDAQGNLVNVTYSWDNTNDHPTYPINEDGYVGYIPKISGYQVGGDVRNDNTDGTYTITRTFRGIYEGIIEERNVVQWVDDYTGYYTGTVTKPTTYEYTQKYIGTVYRKQVIEQNYGNRPNTEQVNEPVNIVTGSYYSTDMDYKISNRGPDIKIIRYYNSVDRRTSDLGVAWRLNYDSNLEEDSISGKVSITYPDGHTVVFEPINGSNQYTTPETVFDILTKNGDSTFDLELKDKRIYRYSSNGQLLKILDQNNNAISLSYDGNGNLDTVTSADGKTLNFTSENGLIKTITDQLGRSITYSYDGDGNLSQVKKIGGGIINYEYNSYGITSITDENNKRFIENEYDEFNRIIKQRDEYGNILEYEYDEINMENTYTFVSTGRSTKYKYNENLYITRKTFDDGTYEEYTYDSYGNRNSVRDRNGNITNYTFDSRGNITSKTDPAPFNYTTSYSYDENNNLTQIARPEGWITTFNYDGNNNLKEKIEKIDSTTNATTVYTYDTHGRLLTLTDAENNTITYEYATGDKPVKIIDDELNEIEYGYDVVNRLKTITTEYGITTFDYNSLDKVEKITDPSGNIKRMKYDSRGNLVKLINPEEYNNGIDDGSGVTYEYDGMDRLISIIDQLGNVSAIQYDEEGNKIKEVNPNYYDEAAGDGLGTGYEYDESKRLIKIINPSGEKSRIKYDGVGNQVKLIDANNYNENTDDGQGTVYIYDELNRLVTIKDTDGNIIRRFVYDSGGRVIKEIDAKGYLSGANDSSRYGTIYKYNLIGWLKEKREPLKDESGTIYYRVTKYEYDKMGKQVKVKKTPEYVTETGEPTLWNSISYTYDGNGRVKTVSDTSGGYMEYEYDSIGNVIKKKIKINDSKYYTVGYHYDSNGRQDRQWIEIDGSDILNGGSGKVNAETFYEYDKNGNVTKIISPEGYETIFEYDDAGRLTAKKEEVKEDSIELKATSSMIESSKSTVYPGQTYEYKVKIAPKEEINAANMKIEYDTRLYEMVGATPDIGPVLLTTDSPGTVSLSVYGGSYTSETNLATISLRVKDTVTGIGYVKIDSSSTYTNKQGEESSFSEAIGKTVISEIPDMNNDDSVQTNDFTITAIHKDIDANDLKYNEKYDINDNNIIDEPDLDYIKDWLFEDKSSQVSEIELIKFLQKSINNKYEVITNTVTRITTYDYDKAGNLIKETDPNGNSITYTYDAYNRLISIEDKEKAKSRVFYDEIGNVIKEILPENYDSQSDNGLGTTYTYDPMNRLTKIVDAQGNIVQKNIYDINGLLIKRIDAEGYKSSSSDTTRYGIEYTYDIGNRIKAITTPESKLKGELSTSYTYDALDNVSTYTDGEGNTTVYERDLWGRATKITDAEGVDTYYEYDYAGNVTKSIDGNSKATSYTYNTMNLISSILDPNNENIIYKYDKEGRLRKEIDRNGQTILYNYNKDSNLKSRNISGTNEEELYLYNKDGSLLASVNNSAILEYEYTVNGYISRKQRNGKTILSYKYDKNGSITGVTDQSGDSVDYGYDILGRLKTVSDNGIQRAKYSYNLDNTINRIDYNTGIEVNYGYDRDKNITSMINKNPQGEIIKSFAYTYSNNGNQLTKVENGQAITYTYDKVNRLKTVNYPGLGLETYNYDGAGNRISKILSGETTTYNYDSRNRMIDRTAGGIITTYSYDGNGNLLEEAKNGEKTSYKYNGFGKMIEATMPNGSWMYNNYDAEGLRFAVEENGFRSEFTFDRGSIITEVDGSGGISTRSIRGLNLVAQKNKQGMLSYYLHNAHGDVVNIVDGAGDILNDYTYDAFGNTETYVEKVSNRFMYSGEQFDKATGLYYLRARYYNPEIGRFIQEDPFRGDGLNLYAYVANNPVKYVDPSGYSKCLVDEGKENTNSQYIMLYDPMHEKQIEEQLRQEYLKSEGLGKGAVVIKTIGHVVSKRYRYAKAEYQLGMYEDAGIDYETSGQALDWSLAEVSGEVAGSYIAKGISKGYNKFKSLGKSVIDDVGKGSKQLFDIDLQLFNKGTGKAISNADDLIESASKLHGKKNTAVGRAFQKHSVRDGTAFVGETTGNPAKNTEQGLKYLNDILGNPNATQTVRNTKAYGDVLEVRLPDGMGARWSADGSKFIGFLERYTK